MQRSSSEPTPVERSAALNSVGLRYAAGAPSPSDRRSGNPPPTERDVWAQFARIDATPLSTIGYDTADWPEMVDREWLDTCRRLNVIPAEGDFLLSLGTSVLPASWLRVELAAAPSVFSSGLSMEFIAVSADGKRYCGVSEEEHEMWIVGGEVVENSG